MGLQWLRMLAYGQYMMYMTRLCYTQDPSSQGEEVENEERTVRKRVVVREQTDRKRKEMLSTRSKLTKAVHERLGNLAT